MRKVLIITYYWPPSGGGGVQRWVKMSKYFKGLGWEPIVFKPENPEYPILDNSFNEEVSDITTISCKIWEPARFLRKLGAKKEANLSSGFVSEGASFTQRLATTIRGNFFIPDARKFWVQPSVKFLSKFLKTNAVDAIISTGPPHSCHLIALELKNKFGLKWIADFRDPWTNIDFYQDLNLTSWADKKHRLLERKVLENADITVAIGKTMAAELGELGAEKTAIITNGFDTQIKADQLDEKFTITHIGRLGKSRNPHLLWKVLGELVIENEQFKLDLYVQLIGNVDGAIKESVTANKLDDQVIYGNNVSNQESLEIQAKSQLLLLLINDTPNSTGILTGKFFEYLSVARPILAIGPLNGDAAELLKLTSAGQMFDYKQENDLKQYILEAYVAYKNGDLDVKSKNAMQFSRKNVAASYINLLNDLM